MGNKNISSSDVENEISSTLNQSVIANINNSCVISQRATNDLQFVDTTIHNSNITMTNRIQGLCKIKAMLDYMATTKTNQNLATKLIESQQNESMLKSNKTSTKMYTKLKQKVNMSTIINGINSVVQNTFSSNRISAIRSNISDVTINQSNQVFNKSLIDQFYKIAIDNNMKQDMDAILKKEQIAKTSPVVGKAISAIGNTFIIIIIVVLIVLVATYFFLRSHKEYLPYLGPVGLVLSKIM